jgi:hypothetical protein
MADSRREQRATMSTRQQAAGNNSKSFTSITRGEGSVNRNPQSRIATVRLPLQYPHSDSGLRHYSVGRWKVKWRQGSSNGGELCGVVARELQETLPCARELRPYDWPPCCSTVTVAGDPRGNHHSARGVSGTPSTSAPMEMCEFLRLHCGCCCEVTCLKHCKSDVP